MCPEHASGEEECFCDYLFAEECEQEFQEFLDNPDNW